MRRLLAIIDGAQMQQYNRQPSTLCRIEAAFVSLDQDETGNEEDIELGCMAPKRDLVRADLECSRSMCLAPAESYKSLQRERWRFRNRDSNPSDQHVPDGCPRVHSSLKDRTAQQEIGHRSGDPGVSPMKYLPRSTRVRRSNCRARLQIPWLEDAIASCR